ncbi:MAG: hypothetical protein CVV22_04790 [Ignavibacteriae bacterium HGW-Ignavibacteriae-1]|nr:MAG: hypothetical protein CVV22_04790 [Ignavibacteriae bacterium HGW-Ignavibacteriae-1]
MFVTSCTDDSTSPIISPHNTDELIPLKIGNTWVHNRTYYDEFLAENSGKVTSTVVSDEMYNGEKYYRIERLNQKSNQKEISPVYYINKSDGFYSLTFDDNNEPETEFIKYPVTEGEIFFNDEIRKSYAEKVDTIISTSAGKFKCIKYVHIIQLDGKYAYKIVTFYCPGIGLIAGENYTIFHETGDQFLFLKSELVSYSLK